jgi:hypothetical protein
LVESFFAVFWVVVEVFFSNFEGRIGAQVIAPYRCEEKDVQRLRVMGDVGQIMPFKFSITDTKLVEASMRYSNIVVNCIGSRWATKNWSVEEANVETANIIAKVLHPSIPSKKTSLSFPLFQTISFINAFSYQKRLQRKLESLDLCTYQHLELMRILIQSF